MPLGVEGDVADVEGVAVEGDRGRLAGPAAAEAAIAAVANQGR